MNPADHAQRHHGSSPAAWTGAVLAALGFFVAAIASVAGPSWPGVAAGAGMVAVAGVLTLVLKALGFGQN